MIWAAEYRRRSTIYEAAITTTALLATMPMLAVAV